jgi:tRNA(adenine34) deaminase
VNTHEHFMRRCIELARLAQATGDAPVGSLVVRDGAVIAEGVESVKRRGDVTAHAEIEAIRLACEHIGSLDLSGCTLYTSVEPCPMCAYAIRLARVGGVVAGARSTNRDAAWDGWSLLANRDILPNRPPPALMIRDVIGAII